MGNFRRAPLGAPLFVHNDFALALGIGRINNTIHVQQLLGL